MERLQLLTLILCLPFLIFAQSKEAQKQKKKEQMEAMKVAYITKELNLTSQEAQSFWPVYNQYNAVLDELKAEGRELKKNHKKDIESLSKMSEKELDQIINKQFDLDEKKIIIQKEYHNEFKKVLPAYKVYLLYKSKNGFKKAMLKRVKENRARQGNQY